MRILFILENYYPAIGGVETLFKTLIDELNKKRIETVVLTTNHHQLPKKETIGHCTIYRYRFISRYLFTILALFPALRHGRTADFIHTTSYNAGMPASIAGLILRKKVVITFHEVWGKLWFKLPFFSRLSQTLHYTFEQMLLRLPFHRFIAVSEFTANRLRKHKIRDDKITMIYNGIDYEKWTNKNVHQSKPSHTSHKKPFKFLYFGRLGISKGLNLLLPAFLKLCNERDDVELKLVLPKKPVSLLNVIFKEIKKFKSDQAPQVVHEIPHTQLLHEIKSSNCVIIPSYSEGFGYTAVESMAVGTPIISSGQGSLKEIVCGNFIQMKSQDTNGLHHAMTLALFDKWEYLEPTNFQLEDTVEKYIQMYESISGKNFGNIN